MEPHEQRELIKQAIKEWLDEQYANLGKYTVKALAVAGIGWFLYEYIAVRGGKFP